MEEDAGTPVTNPKVLVWMYSLLTKLSSTTTVVSDSFWLPFITVIGAIVLIDWLSWREIDRLHRQEKEEKDEHGVHANIG